MHIPSVRWPFAIWQRPTLNDRAIGWLGITASLFAGATAMSFGKQLTTALSPLSLLFLSESLTLLFTVLSFGFLPLLRSLVAQKRQTLIPIAAIGLLNSVIAPLLAFMGLKHTSAVNAELFIRAELLFLVLLAAIILGEKLKKMHWIAGGCVVLGIFIVSLGSMEGSFTLQRGDLLMLLAAFVYAVGSILYKKYLHHIAPELMVFARTCTAMIVFFGISPFMQYTFMEELRAFPAVLLSALMGYAFLSRFISLFGFYEALDHLSVRTISLLLPFGIILSVLFANIYLGEPIRWFHMAGGGLVLLGIVLLRVFSMMENHEALKRQLKQQQRQHV